MSGSLRFFGRVLRPTALALVAALAGAGCDDNDNRGTITLCDPIDMLVIFDTSGSMDDEAEAVCTKLDAIKSEIEDGGIEASLTVMGITENEGNVASAWSCVTDNIQNFLGDSVPDEGDPLINNEDWGGAVALAAESFPWFGGNIRVISPISDEAAAGGDPCDDPGEDRDSVENAITIASRNEVIVSPISGTGAEPCVKNLMIDLANGADGVHRSTLIAAEDIARNLINVAADTCETFGTF